MNTLEERLAIIKEAFEQMPQEEFLALFDRLTSEEIERWAPVEQTLGILCQGEKK